MKRKRLLLALLAITLAPTTTFSQGWLGISGTTLYSQPTGPNPLSSIKVGIGTATPTALLHTTGSLRFENLLPSDTLSRILVQTYNGDVYYRNASTLTGGGNSWQLNGNSISINNFLGTTNNDDVRIRTNNVQRSLFSKTGSLVVGNNFSNTSSHKLIVNSGTAGAQAGEDAHVLVSGSGPSVKLSNDFTVTSSSKLSGIGLVTMANQYYKGSSIGDFVIHNYGTKQPIVFVTNGASTDTFTTLYVAPRMRIEPFEGYVGVNTGDNTSTKPTTDRFHVHLEKGETVRFSNLPIQEGKIVVTDIDGRLYESEYSSSELFSKLSEYQGELATLKQEIMFLKEQLNSSKSATPGYLLEQNIPNPFKGSTDINYVIYKSFKSAAIRITDINGRVVNEYILNKSSDKITFTLQYPGVYYYSLYIDGRLMDTKKMIGVSE